MTSSWKRFESETLVDRKLIYRIGEASIAGGCLTMPGQSFAALA